MKICECEQNTKFEMFILCKGLMYFFYIYTSRVIAVWHFLASNAFILLAFLGCCPAYVRKGKNHETEI